MAARAALILFLAFCDIALFGRMMWGQGGIIEYRQLKRQYSQIRSDIANLDADNMALSREIRLLQGDNQYMEKMVRQKLRYLRDNEIVYLFPDANGVKSGESANDSEN